MEHALSSRFDARENDEIRQIYINSEDRKACSRQRWCLNNNKRDALHVVTSKAEVPASPISRDTLISCRSSEDAERDDPSSWMKISSAVSNWKMDWLNHLYDECHCCKYSRSFLTVRWFGPCGGISNALEYSRVRVWLADRSSVSKTRLESLKICPTTQNEMLLCVGSMKEGEREALSAFHRRSTESSRWDRRESRSSAEKLIRNDFRYTKQTCFMASPERYFSQSFPKGGPSDFILLRALSLFARGAMHRAMPPANRSRELCQSASSAHCTW